MQLAEKLTAKAHFLYLFKDGDIMDNYMGDSHVGDAILQDISKWTGEKEKQIQTAARKIRNEMRTDLEKELDKKSPNGTGTPVRNYPHNNGVVMRITVHRIGSGKKAQNAKREAAPEAYQPGAMRAGWVNAALRNKEGRYIIGVRNKTVPMLIHLVNFDHDLVTHGKRKGVVHGIRFVTKVQDKGREKLDEEIKKILDE